MMPKPPLVASVMIVFLGNLAHAREAYLRHVPSPFQCTTCHEDPRQGRQNAQIRNGFGFDYVAARQNWSDMCHLDSDGDGITNAIELLDPDCVWRPAPIGQPNTPLPMGAATHPGDSRDPDQCGDGLIQGSEDCDSLNLGARDCESLGYLSGTLRCSITCNFDETACTEYPTLDMFRPSEDMALEDLSIEDLGAIEVDSGGLAPMDVSLKDASSANLQDAMLRLSDWTFEHDSTFDDGESGDDQVEHVDDSDLVMPVAHEPMTGCSKTLPSAGARPLVLLCALALLRRRHITSLAGS